MTSIYDRLRGFVGTSFGLGIPDEDLHQERLALAASMLNKHKAMSVLDVGCGYGDLRMHILRCKYLGIDVNDWMIEEARRRLPATPFKTISLEALDPDPARFDAVAALGVLSTVPPTKLQHALLLLERLASRMLCVSFLKPAGVQAPEFFSHDMDDVVMGRKVLQLGHTDGETTVLIGLTS